MTQQEVKAYIDGILIESDEMKQVATLNELMMSLVQYMLQGYKECRDITQFAIGQLERIPSVCVPYFFLQLCELIGSVDSDQGKPAFFEYINIEWDDSTKVLLDKVAPFLAGEHKTCELHSEIADALTYEERRFLASSLNEAIQSYGVKAQWDEDEFQNAVLFCNILYPICKKDNMMGLLFHAYRNIIDRLNTSGYSQHARDLAEGILIVGYNEGMEAEAFFAACRAYTGANNAIAGLLFFFVSLLVINRNGERISSRFAFDLYWQYLKICRTTGIYPKTDVAMVTKKFELTHPKSYDRLSYYHTLFSTRLMANEDTETLADDITTFLDQNREVYFHNLEHGSMPWITLILSLQELKPEGNYAGLMPYVEAAKQVVAPKGNELYFDILEEKNLRKHLKEELYKLQETRNRSDYTMDNRTAMILAKKLLQQGYDSQNVVDFLMAMSAKTDFSMVLPIKDVDGFYKRFDIQKVDGDELGSVYNSPKLVTDLMCADEEDVIFWIGRGKTDFLLMELLGTVYSMAGVMGVTRDKIKEAVEKSISSLRYERETKEPGKTVYVKSKQELEDEGQELVKELDVFAIDVPEEAKRFLVMKDIEIASYPHNLFVDDRTGDFVSSALPCCNALSTEVLFKTNTLDPLPKDFKKSFWIPYGSEEFTFDMIYGKLEDVIQQYGIAVQQTVSMESPLVGDLTILCAHGATDISKTEMFYVDDKPIIDTLRCVGRGKVAVMFICHSGSISRSVYDNAMHTLVKQLILKGYSSIVAPMWSLPTDIITPWLSVFLESIETGEYIIDAVYKANMRVKQEFVAPSAWACLHLFGNPYTRVADVPRLQISIEDDERHF